MQRCDSARSTYAGENIAYLDPPKPVVAARTDMRRLDVHPIHTRHGSRTALAPERCKCDRPGFSGLWAQSHDRPGERLPATRHDRAHRHLACQLQCNDIWVHSVRNAIEHGGAFVAPPDAPASADEQMTPWLEAVIVRKDSRYFSLQLDVSLAHLIGDDVRGYFAYR